MASSPIEQTKAADLDNNSASNETTKSKPNKTTSKKSITDTASYGKTIGGKLKLKGVEMKSTKAKGPTNATPDSASDKLKDRIKKKSDRYAMVTFHEEE